jgi:hypothetical protein
VAESAHPVAEAAVALEVVPLLLLLGLLALAAQALALGAAALVAPRVAAALVAVGELARLEAARPELLALRRPVVHQVERLLLRGRRENTAVLSGAATRKAAHAGAQQTRLVLREEVEHRVHAAGALVARCEAAGGRTAASGQAGLTLKPSRAPCARRATHFRRTCRSPSASSQPRGPACRSC